MPALEGLEVFLSPIHGYGVRTLRKFREGDIVVVGDGYLWREDEDFDDEYSLIVAATDTNPDGSEGPPLYYDLTDQTRWINHSCDPNTEVDVEFNRKRREAKPLWYALRDIKVGQELSYDYAFSGHLAIPCACRATQCRGLIVDPDEIHLIPAKYRRLLRPPLSQHRSAS
jgi:uncharacterized protein